MVPHLFNVANYHYAFPAWPPLIVGICISILGAVVLLRERASKVSLAFLGLTLTGGLWLLSVAAIFSATKANLALTWAKIEHIGVVLIPTALFYFSLIVTRKLDRFRFAATLALLTSALFGLTVFFSDQFVAGLHRYPWGTYPQYGPLAAPFLVFFFSLYIGSLFLYWNTYRQLSPGSQQYRLKRLFLAFSIGFLGAIDYLACFHIAVYPVGYLPVYTCILLLAEVIWHYRFPDITAAFAASEIIATMPSALFVFDHDGIICIVNEMACALLGKSEADLVGWPMSSVISGFADPVTIEHRLLDGSLHDYEATIRNPAGESRICTFSASMIRDAQGRPLASVCLVKDITAHRRAEEALRASEARFWRLVESNIIGFMIVDEKGTILEANDAFLKLLGYTREDLALGRVGGPTMTPPEYRLMDDWMMEKLRVTGLCPPLEKEYVRKDGARIPVLVGVVQLAAAEHSYVCFVIDATERRRAMEALEQAYDELELRVDERTKELKQEIVRREKAEDALRNQSITDALTGLYNRRGFMTLAEQHLQVARRNRKGFPLFMADLDNLKPINDTFGHAEGDYALKQAAILLKQTFRESDIVARIGGDEFAIVATEDSENQEALLLGRLQQKLDDYNRYSGRHYKLGLSMGSVRVDPANGSTIEQMLAHADDALYDKKKHKSAFLTVIPPVQSDD